MAGKIALGIILAALLFAFGYNVHKIHHSEELPRLPFKVARVVDEGDTRAASGMKPPFTVLVYEGPYVQLIVPGDLGPTGREFYLPDPRHNSASTSEP